MIPVIDMLQPHALFVALTVQSFPSEFNARQITKSWCIPVKYLCLLRSSKFFFFVIFLLTLICVIFLLTDLHFLVETLHWSPELEYLLLWSLDVQVRQNYMRTSGSPFILKEDKIKTGHLFQQYISEWGTKEIFVFVSSKKELWGTNLLLRSWPEHKSRSPLC